MTIYIQHSAQIPFLSPKEVAKITGLSIRTLARMRENKTGPKFHQFSLRKIQYYRKDVNEWLEAKRSK